MEAHPISLRRTRQLSVAQPNEFVDPAMFAGPAPEGKGNA
jgi:hypothetical protein